ncbi:hypothetical protein LJU02_05415 [Corynebacterium pseudotuberculosis]|uniref:Secreted protein n=1 Tax=Corynebacterium pseudotuberculosis 258 TaxID=1168865 RepID=A0AAU8PQT4_CORPS|nr:hypothetical protein [Corynebacterium pseudotuberculosis]AER69105.1 Hypothetical protein Cp106_1036 [Corynebacterium pseudotuberculosis 1/06-A]ADK28852.2 hypothetical protein CPFRC_05320 [Corynebacterium pseudotuberculosis FRC41]ADL20939.1 hypothetical protein CP1002_07825 [Corynebacterium pseudotuberculosis 1002]ADO26327.1 hypothetical protein CPI19_06195 [Corynebacterium pseudotuberculosis I19]AEP70302.1 Hypothetical protein Cp4202_1046 [Corynebacterium pseudotuberculosis 42/02-A]
MRGRTIAGILCEIVSGIMLIGAWWFKKATAHDLTENNGPMVLCLGALFFAVSGVVLLVAGRLRKRRRLGMITTIDYE